VPNTHKRHSLGSGVLLSCAGHWPPKYRVDGGYIHRAYCRVPGRFIPFEGRFVGGGSCRALLCFGLAGIYPAAGTSLAPS
jgi:hypothetical protein